MRYLILVGIILLQSCTGFKDSTSRLPASLTEPLHEDILGCFSITRKIEGNGAKQKLIEESKSVVFRASEELSSIQRYPFRKEEYGKVFYLTGSQTSWNRGLHSIRFSFDKPHEVASLNKHFFIQAPQDSVLEVRNEEQGLYLVKDSEGIYKAILRGTINSTLNECTTDKEVVKKWIREASKFSPM